MSLWAMLGIIFLTLCGGCALGLITDYLSTPSGPRETAPAKQLAAAYPSGPQHPGTCPICGMDDPDHLEARWRTWPVHTDCVEWLMPGGLSFVDEYNNPALSDSPKRGSILGGVTAAEAGAALAAMFAADNDRPEHIG